MTQLGPSARSRTTAIALDQAFSSTSNGLIVYAIAIVSSPEFFGELSVIMTAIVAVLAFTRGSLGTPLLLKSDKSPPVLRLEAMYSLTSAFGMAFLISAAMLCAVPHLGAAALILAASAPFMCAQDVLRHLAISAGEPIKAVVWDGIWCIGTILLLIYTWLNHQASAGLILGAWGLLAVVSFVGLAISFRTPPRIRGFVTWARTDANNRLRYGIDLGLEPLGLLVVFAIVALAINAEATAALRGSSALLAPLAVIGATIQLVVISESTRRNATPTDVWRALIRVVSVVAAVTLSLGAVFLLLPVRWGFLLLGESFGPAQQVLPATLAEYVAASALFCVAVYLRTLGRSGHALTLKVTLLSVTIVAVVFAARATDSAVGVAWGMAIANAAVTLGSLLLIRPWHYPAAKAEYT